MPLYEYLCDACGNRFEIIQKFSDAAPDACRVCGKGPVHRQMSSPAIQFKGSGWYITDYAKKSGTDSSPAPKSSDAKTGDAKTSEAKSDSGAKSESTGKSESSTPAAATPAPSTSTSKE
jgi:putative FmdB family regulatory protein